MKHLIKTMAFTLLGLVLSMNLMAVDLTYKHTFATTTQSLNTDAGTGTFTVESGIPLTMTCAKNGGSNFASYAPFRLYNKNQITIAANTGYVIKSVSIEFNTVQSLTISTDAPNYSYSNEYVFTPQDANKNASSCTTVTFTNGNSSQAKIISMTITYASKAAAIPFTVTLKDTETPITEESVGEGVTLPTRTTTCEGYSFAGWSETNCGTEETTTAPTLVTITDNKYYPSKDVNLYPVFKRSEAGAASNDFVKVTSAPTDWSGDYIIANDVHAMKGEISSNQFTSADVTITDNTITTTNSAIIWTLSAGTTSGQYSIKNNNTNTYAKITGTSSSNAALSDDPVYFTIESSSTTGVWKVVSVDKNERCFSYYSSNSCWRTYAKSSNTTGNLYKRNGGGTINYYIATPQCDPSAPSIAASAVAFGTTYAVTGSEQITVTGANLSNAIVASIKEENTIYSTEGTLTAEGGNLTIKYDATGKEAGQYDATLVLTSGETSVEYAISLTLKTYTTCAQANSLAKDATATLGAFDVVYVNGNYIYIKDNTGSTLLYKATYGLAAGDHVEAGMEVKGNPYNGLPEAIPTTAFSALEVTHSAFTPTPEALSAAPTAADVNKYVKLENVKANETEYFTTSSSSDETTVEFYSTDVTVRNGFKQALSFASGTYYDMIGTVARYNSTIQIYPISIEEKEATKYAITFTEPIENGSASVDADDNKAVAGATITITTYPADGYKDGTITVVANDETPIEVTDKQFEMPAQPVTITVTFVEKAKYAITWNDRGNNTQTNVTEGEGLVLPENPTAPIGWEFVGWTAIEGYSHETDAPAFAKNGDAVTMATTYYAVYAMVDGDAATGWKLSTGAPVADEQVILTAKGGEDYYAMYAASDGAAATATKLVLDANGIVTNEERLYWSVEEGTYSEKTGLALTNDLTKTVSDEEQKEYLHLNASATKLTTSFQNGVFEFTQSGEGYILHGVVNNKYLTFAYTADPETASYDVAGEGGCVLYVFRYVSAQYFKYTTAPAPQVTIHFELGDGEGSIDDVMINKGSDYVVTSSEPTPATGYDFVGWLYNEVTYVAGQTISNVQTDITLTAQYEAKTYAINYDLNGGNWDGEAGVATYTYGEGAILPTNVEKDGNNFAGWYAPDAEDPTIEIGATETGDKSFTAHWIPATSRTITYVGADENIEFSTKPMSVDGEDFGFEVTYTLAPHYQINSIVVKVGETTLTEDEVTWNTTSLTVMPEAESFADNVTITFDIQPIVFTVQWLVNGQEFAKQENVLEGTTYSELTKPENNPADDTFENCDANKFMGWAVMDWEGTQTKADFEAVQVTDGYEIKENQTTFYAVFATEGEGAVKVGDVLWAEDFSVFSANDVPTESNENTVVYGDATLTYTTEKSGTKIYDAKLAGGESPEILIAESGGSFGCSNIPTAGVAKMNFTFYSNKNSGISVSSSTTGITVGTLTYTGTSAPYIYSCEINNPNKLTTFQLQINKSQSSNSREDNISLTVAEAPVEITNFITNCVVTTYRVKFDANAPVGETIGGTVPEAVDVDPAEDYTIPTDNYLTANHYTQIGWNEDKTATKAQTTVEKMDAGENTTLYAVWQAKDFEISVKTAPTKVEYKTNATFDPEGLVITKTYDGGFSEDIEYAGNEDDFTFEPSLSTPLTTAITEVTITYAGKTCTQAITVEEAVIPIYYWVANATELQDGDVVVLGIANYDGEGSDAVAGEFDTKYFTVQEAEIVNGILTSEDAVEFTVGYNGNSWTLTYDNKLVGATKAKELLLASGTTTWTITFDANGNATIANTTTTSGAIKFNTDYSNYPRFTNYASGGMNIQIYAKRDTRKTLREELADGKMYSFCPAYNLAYVEGAIFYQPDYMDAAYVHFVEATEIKAGYGYILEGEGDDLKAFEVGEALTTAVTADADNTRGMQGVLEGDKSEGKAGFQFTETSYNHVVVVNNHLQYVGALNIVPVGRAYLDLGIIATLEPTTEQARPGARRVAINFGGQAPTDINNLNGATAPMKVLRDGQLYIIRDTKTYNAQGIEVQ